METKYYNKKVLTLALYLFISWPVLAMTKFVSNHYIDELSGINYILAIIALPCTILYYKIRKQKNLFIYILVYLSILIEQFSNLVFDNMNIAMSNNLVTSVIFRCMLFYLLFKPKNQIINYLESKKQYSIIFCILINIMFVINDYFIECNISNSVIFILLYVIIIIFYYYIKFKLIVRSIKEKDFIQSLYLISTISLGLKILPYCFQYMKTNSFNRLIMWDKLFFTASFSCLIIGLFIELKYLLIEKHKLSEDVRIISDDIKELKCLEKVRTQFFANLSHELKTPLNIIFSCIQLLNINNNSSYEELGIKYSKYSTTIKQNCYRMIRLINNLVDITKIDSGFMNMNFHNYDIVSLIENITLSVVPYMKTKHINITFDTSFEELEIKCDSDSIERIILNLLSNSMKFAKDNGNIDVLLNYDYEFVTIRVVDDGIGIPKHKQKSVFDVFVQGDKSLTRKKEGSGIGLSLVKSLIKLHDGKIELISEENKGTEIIIKLPNIKLECDNCHAPDYDSRGDTIISKINIEFSDIYDLF